MDLQFEVAKKHSKYFAMLEDYARKIKRTAQKILGDVEVYVFGSALRGDYIPGASDIDILIVGKVPESVSERSRITAKILKEIGDFFSPFEIHYANEKSFEIYKAFAKPIKKY